MTGKDDTQIQYHVQKFQNKTRDPEDPLYLILLILLPWPASRGRNPKPKPIHIVEAIERKVYS